MNTSLDVDKPVAEKILMRIMEPIRKGLAESKARVGEDWDDSEETTFTIGQLREMDRDLGSIGLVLANRYREQADFRSALATVAQENVRLTGAINILSELLEQEKEQSAALANALEKTKTVNGKLKEVTGWGVT